MVRKLGAVALIVRNPQGNILILREFESKPQIGKFAGMYSVPMETIKEGESEESALARLIEEELPGFNSTIQVEPDRVSVYHINQACAFLYFGSMPDSALPADGVNTDVGDYKWLKPTVALGLWLRQGAKEMIADYIIKASRVIRYCQPVSDRPSKLSARL